MNYLVSLRQLENGTEPAASKENGVAGMCEHSAKKSWRDLHDHAHPDTALDETPGENWFYCSRDAIPLG